METNIAFLEFNLAIHMQDLNEHLSRNLPYRCHHLHQVTYSTSAHTVPLKF